MGISKELEAKLKGKETFIELGVVYNTPGLLNIRFGSTLTIGKMHHRCASIKGRQMLHLR